MMPSKEKALVHVYSICHPRSTSYISLGPVPLPVRPPVSGGECGSKAMMCSSARRTRQSAAKN